jgi:crossover junction endodeoxyribonuclease RuvC
MASVADNEFRRFKRNLDGAVTVIGIDPSISSAGVAVLYDESTTSGPALTTIKSGGKSNEPIGVRLAKMKRELRAFLFDWSYSDGINAIVAAVELPVPPLALGPSSGGKGYPALCMAYGVFFLVLADMDIPTIGVSTNRLKQYATEKGNAPKDDVLAQAKAELEYEGNDNNQSDALWLAYIAAEVLGKRDEAARTDRFNPAYGWLATNPSREKVISELYAENVSLDI